MSLTLIITSMFSLRDERANEALKLADKAVETSQEVRRTSQLRNGSVRDLETTLKAMSDDLRK